MFIFRQNKRIATLMASNKCYPWILSSDVVYQNGIGTDQIKPSYHRRCVS